MKLAENDHPNRLLPLKGIRVFDLSRLLPGGPAAYFSLPPKMGQDSRSFLQEAGFGIEGIQSLVEGGIIYTAQIEEGIPQSK
jgi:crotonobetainyl-CoA:carnitine CoA-transferase CaiB-like acyl-CoA transferase